MNNIKTDSLSEKLRQKIVADGVIGVDAYMAACLGDPEFGYYLTRDPLGAQGDFVTSPEISQIFGELLGLWAAEVWNQMGAPSAFHLVELGPGRGTLMSDALRASKVLAPFHEAVSVHLVEVNPVLRDAQKNALSDYDGKVFWHEAVSDLPDGPMIVFANEFFDALPVQQFQYHDGQWFERGVGLTQDKFAFQLIDGGVEQVPELLEAYDVQSVENFSSLDSDVIFEYRKNCLDMLSVFADKAKSNPLALLAIDYGHERSGFGDTLQAVRTHKYADPLVDPGMADLTTQVDFNQLNKFSINSGLNCYGPMTQGQFLLMLGLEARLNQLLQSADAEQEELIKTGALRLVAPEQMGVLFKVMGITSPDLPKPPPFR